MPSTVEKIYLSSPIFVQQIIVAIYGWKWYRRRYNIHFDELTSCLYAHDKWTATQFKEYQENNLERILTIAWNAPYYREIFSSARISRNDPPFTALGKLPYLSKEVLRVHARDLLTQKNIPRSVMVFKSSGTTGTPTEIYYTPEFHALELAVPAVRNLGWAGIDYRARRVMFGVRKVCRFDQNRPPFWRYSPVENMAYASIYHLSQQNLPYYIEFLRHYRPQIIMGYPSSLYTVSRYALDNNDLPAPAAGVFTTSETVSDRIRDSLEAAWQCKVHDRYGAVEGCLFASQCEYGSYHVSPEAGIVEIIDQDGMPCPPGQMGEVICTGLQNTLQPLIRYRIGDVARWAENQECPCGRAMPILEAIEGRFEDICVTPDGREMLRFDTVFKGVDGIKEAQVVQEKVDQFIVYVVPVERLTQQTEELIKYNMRLHVGQVQTEVIPVGEIPRSSSGKFRAVISKLSMEEKRQALRSSQA